MCVCGALPRKASTALFICSAQSNVYSAKALLQCFLKFSHFLFFLNKTTNFFIHIFKTKFILISLSKNIVNSNFERIG